MYPDNSQIGERWAWEGFLGFESAVMLAVALALLAGWSLWRQRAALGRGWAAAFWVLRVAAFGCALWMLAGPTHQRIERTTTTQSVAIFADDSESMTVVDPIDPADGARWALAVSGEGGESPIVRADSMSVALGAALADCQRFAQFVAEHRPTRQLEAAVGSIAVAVERAAVHAEALTSSLERADPSLADRASRIVSLLEGPVGESIAAMRKTFGSEEQSVGEDFTVRLDSLIEGITGAQRRAQILAADLASAEPGESDGEADLSQMSRREKAGRALDAFESSLGDDVTSQVRIRRFRFDRQATPITIDHGWSGALRGAPAAGLTPTSFRDSGPDAADDAVDSQVATNLSAVLDQLSREQPGQATRLAVIFSDGRHNDVDALAPQDVAAGLSGVPIFVVPIGNAAGVRDVLLHRVEAPAAVAEKDSAVVDVIVTAYDCDGQSSAVVLRHEGQEVDRKPLEFSGGRSDYRVRFTIPATELGWQEYIVEVEPVEDEVNAANNFMPVSFEVVRDRIRILLVDGLARWEYRYLNQLFRRDQHIEFDELLYYPRVHGSGALADRPELPADVEGWAPYDIVILGDISAGQLTAESQQGLDEFVRTRGGNLIVVAGRNHMPGEFVGHPLMDLLPVEQAPGAIAEHGYSLVLTDEGRFHSALAIADSASESRDAWQRIYGRFSVFGLSTYSRPKSTARTLIEALSDQPGEVRGGDGESREVEQAFLSWHRVGAGRVAYLAAPETYRLRFRLGDRLHHRFWGQLLRWITAANVGAGSDLVRLQTDRSQYTGGEPVEVTVWLRDASGRPLSNENIQVEARTFSDAAEVAELTPDADVPGRYFGALEGLTAGAYQLTVQGRVIESLLPPGGEAEQTPATITIRTSDNLEMVNTQSNRALLEQLAQMTGGQVIPPTAIGEVLRLVTFTPEVHERIERTPLWNRWSSLWIVLGCLFTEWIVRKSKGLV